MLKFFRRYQKIFFAVISFFIIISFTFFGTQNAVSGMKRSKDKDIAIAYDGSKIKLSDVDHMSMFLVTDNTEISLLRHNQLRPNLFNDGVLRNDIFKSGLAKIFFEKYLDQMKPFFEEKLKRIQKYTPFVHFYDASISVASIWEKHNPQILTLLDKLKSSTEVNLEFFSLYVDLYNEQMKLQPELLRRMMIFQEKQMKLQPDQRLYQDSLSLFGYESAIDWFGRDFIDLVSQFIINTSTIAEEKGYEVTFQEALSDLMSNLKKSLNNQVKGSFSEYYKRMLSHLRMNEKAAGKVWRRVMLFRRYFKDVSNNTLVDSLAYKEFARYTRTKANVKLYKLPKHMQINSFEDLMRFEMYLIASTHKHSPLEVPNSLLSVEEVEKNYPQLVEKQYLVRVKHTNLEKAAIKVQVKDMYLWQLEDKNWNVLRNKFAFIPYANTKKDRLDVIDRLEFYQKTKLDAFSRKEIVKNHPKMIHQSLKNQKVKQYKFFVNSKDTKLPIAIKDADQLIGLMDTKDLINNYTQDDDNYYYVEVVQRPTHKYLISLERALKNHVLDDVLTAYLKDIYLIIRDEYPKKFKDSDDDYKPFESIRQELGQIVFADTINAIKSSNYTKSKSLDDLSKYRLYSFVSENLKNILLDDNYLQTIEKQFRMIAENIEVSRSKNPNWVEKKAFLMEEKKYSSLNLLDGNIEFIYLQGITEADIPSDKIEIAKDAISAETSALLTKKLMKSFIEKKCIVLPIREKTNDV